ncbi:MAG: tetratricopeptide repeat protein, partial [Verrucomicrobia bacterium]|nr:tetratricopeptide repeat protein [Verrucomicrobiota bacterium]
FAAGAALGTITARLEKSLVGAVGDDWALSLAERILIAGRIFWFYLGKLLWPVGLCFNYPRWNIESGNLALYLFPVAALALLIGTWYMRKEFGRGPLTALLFFGVSLAPALGFVDVYPMRFSFVADHFQYLASAGIIVFFAAVATRAAGILGVAGSLRARIGLILALAVILGGLTASRARTFGNGERLWYDTLRKNPRSWLAHSNVGNIHLSERRLQQARDHFGAALHLKPDYEVTHYNLGLLLALEGQYEQALEQYGEAVRIRPDFTDAYCRMGSCYMLLGELDEAIRSFAKAVEASPEQFEIHYQLAALCHAAGNHAEALRHYKTTTVLNPWFPDAFSNMAWILSTHADPELRDGSSAVKLATRACELTGYRNPLFLTSLAAAYAETGRFEKAIATETRAADTALSAGNTELVRQCRHRLELYHRGEPHRETVQ